MTIRATADLALKRRRWPLLCGALIVGALVAWRAPQQQAESFAHFVEPGFPFISTTIDARNLGPGFAPRNVVARGLVLMLGNGSYAVFDPDLLRMAAGWRADSLDMATMAQVSYHEPRNNRNRVPKLLGTPLFTTGIYPGWSGADPDFQDPRRPGPYAEDVGRGPLPPSLGEWKGVYVVGDRAVLAYAVQGMDIYEQPGSVRDGNEVGIVRAFRMGRIDQPLTLVATEVVNARSASVSGSIASIVEGGDTVTLVGMVDAPRGARLQVIETRHVTLQIPAGASSSLFRVVAWRGPAARRASFERMLRGRTTMVDFDGGGPAHWPEAVTTRSTPSPDTAAYVIDRIAVPIPNPWRRNVRVADTDFFSDGRAAVVTFEGDVWIVTGIDRDLGEVRWKRFSSGLYEPLSVQVVDDRIYVYSRDGIVRLHDLNGDGEADFYESFSNLPIQSGESREWPLSMDEKPGGGFYLSKGGALDNGPATSPVVAPGFRAGSWHSGTVLEVSADGRQLSVVASGLREPFIGAHPERDLIVSSDQQGNFVPSTGVYLLSRGGYYGVPVTAHRDGPPADSPPLVWIPHTVDQSASGEVWVTGADRMGFGEEALIHLSYGKPGAFRIYADSSSGTVQGAAVSLLGNFTSPILKGQYNPQDGNLYLTGFVVWGSKATDLVTFARLRHTGQPSPIPLSVQSGVQGIVLRFAAPLDRASATDVRRFTVKRWNYQRTSAYGSPHFKLDGSPGQDTLEVASANLSSDGRSVFVVIRDMRPAMQLQMTYDLHTTGGRAVTDTVYLTPTRVAEMDLSAAGFGDVDWRGSIAAAAITPPAAAPASASPTPAVALGAELYQRIGCVACHSVDGTTAGKLGPTFRGLFGSLRTFTNGANRRADEVYLRQSIREPGSQIVQGYNEGMPSYLGVLSEAEVESLVLYIRSLGT